MPRKKTNPEQPEVLPVQSLDLMDALDRMATDIAMDSTEAIGAAIDFEKALLNVAHSISQQAVRVNESDQEAERVKTAERQVKLIGKLFTQLQRLTQPEGR